VNIALLLDLVADTLDDRVALTDDVGDLTYADLRALARAAAGGLAAEGARTLAFADVGSRAVPAALFGAAWAGAAYAPLNFRLPAPSLEAQVARLDRPHTVASEELAGHLGDAPGDTTGRWLAGLVPGDGDDETPFDPEPAGPAVVLFTSGTSGTPKAAVLSHDNLLAYVMETVEFAGAGEDEALLLAAPPFHIAGVAAVLTSVYSGRRLLPLSAFTPEGWLRTARDRRATHAFLVPTMLARVVQALAADPGLAVPTLRAISYGGARMAMPVLEEALRLFPGVDFVNAYGLTETSSTIAVLGPEEHRLALSSDDPEVRRRLRSAGRPLPGVEVAIVDETGTPALAGVTGAIRVRGPQVGGAYLDTAPGVDDAGWLVTGDVGFLDDEGYLFVESRADDVIIKGGENLSPSEIEDVLLRHPSVVAAAVVGVPDPEWGEVVAAAVVVEGGTDAAEAGAVAADLAGWVREHLGSFKAPTRVVVVEELPSTATGKLLRRSVRDRLAAGDAPTD
jgi:acyl-CoA synthetase (AMP-forming)/AMP-acid ligase II